jgi:two-component system chemotaxis sensor kinase CheA
MTFPAGPPDDELIASFLDDYFAESEEHLIAVRGALLRLESADGDDPSDTPARLEELFRSFHSLKGISAMVGVHEAERLAHELESALKALRSGDVPLTAESVLLLTDGTSALEAVIAAKRAGDPAPAVDPLADRLAAFARRTAAASAGSAEVRGSSPRPTSPSTADRWRFTFRPSAALVDRGVRVDTVQARLGSIGTVLDAAPRVTGSGGIAFEFTVMTSADPADFEVWRGDGLTWDRIAEADAETPRATTDAPPPAATDPGILAPSHYVRVDLRRLDEVMQRVADLVATRGRLAEHLGRLERVLPSRDARPLLEIAQALERQIRDLREDVMRVRLVRVDEIFRRMPFVARDVARESGKSVRVSLTGQDTEIDKYLVERMLDPVLHLVRNAVSHGIELPDSRLAAGKPPQGTISLTASTSGEMVCLEIADDGEGIDVAAVADQARAAGLPLPDGPLELATLLDVLAAPGFSTRRQADRASGRGIGMAVVKATVEELGGTLRVSTEPGRGTQFTIALPVTLAITDALITVASGHTFAVPQSSVQEVLEIEEGAVRRIEPGEIVPYRQQSLPLLRLSTLLGLGDGRPERFHAFVVGTGQQAVALGVDRITGQREIVVRALEDALLKVNGISGATELGDGRVVLILDVLALARIARRRSQPPRVPPRALRAPARGARGERGAHP